MRITTKSPQGSVKLYWRKPPPVVKCPDDLVWVEGELPSATLEPPNTELIVMMRGESETMLLTVTNSPPSPHQLKKGAANAMTWRTSFFPFTPIGHYFNFYFRVTAWARIC
jgi:hypothetical protein